LSTSQVMLKPWTKDKILKFLFRRILNVILRRNLLV
jgi:hypothetical protein